MYLESAKELKDVVGERGKALEVIHLESAKELKAIRVCALSGGRDEAARIRKGIERSP